MPAPARAVQRVFAPRYTKPAPFGKRVLRGEAGPGPEGSGGRRVEVSVSGAGSLSPPGPFICRAAEVRSRGLDLFALLPFVVARDRHEVCPRAERGPPHPVV